MQQSALCNKDPSLSGGLMCSIVIGSTKCNFNPDNIATPIAASLGDVVTLGIIASIANLLYSLHGKCPKTLPLSD